MSHLLLTQVTLVRLHCLSSANETLIGPAADIRERWSASTKGKSAFNVLYIPSGSIAIPGITGMNLIWPPRLAA